MIETRAGQRGVALEILQALARLRHGDERGRARRLHRHHRPAQVQLVGDARGQEVLVVAKDGLEFAKLVRPGEILHVLAVRAEIGQQVGIEAQPGEKPDGAAVLPGVASGIL